jgi:peptidoglycan/LPS O-acetylase OafA/YrhL
MEEVQPRSGQIIELQSLRGIAALTVAIGHALTYYYATSSYGSMVLNGRGAVVVFFVLSGYVLTRSLRSTHFDRHSVLYFYGQRAFRIYPAMWAASTLGLLYLVALHWQIRLADGSFGAPGAFRLDRFSPPFIVGSFTGMVTYILPQLWSIHVEILGSLAMPAIAFVALHRRRRALWMLMVMAVAISYLFGSYTIYHSALFFIDFVVGAALAVGALNPLLHNLPVSRLLIPVGLIGLSLTRFLPITDYFSPTAHLIETVLAALVIGLLAERETPKFMRSAPLLFIGEISYSIYLLFFAVMCIIAKGFAVFETHEHIAISVTFLSILLAFFTFAVVVPLAWLSYIYVEQPGIRLGKIVLARWRNTLMPPGLFNALN